MPTTGRRGTAGLGALSLVLGGLCLVPTGPPAAAVEPAPPVIVSVNGVDFATSRDPRPQTYAGVLENATLRDGISVRWGPAGDEARFSLHVDSSEEFPLHLGVMTAVGTGTPGAEDHDVLGELGSSAGEIQVLDLAATPDGRITRFDVVISAPGGGGRFGELRMGVPETTSLVPTARLLTWPTTGREAVPYPVVDVFRNTSGQPVTVGGVSVHGGASRDFRVARDGCSGRVLGPGQDCRLELAFTPRQGGPRVSTLVVPTSAGATTVPLSASAPLGRSSMVVEGDAQAIHAPWKETYSPLTSVAFRYPERGRTVLRSVIALDETGRQFRDHPRDRMYLELTSTSGPLRTGTWRVNEPDSRYGFAPSAKNVNCSGNLLGTVRVHRFTVDAHQQPTSVDLDADLHCDYVGVDTPIKVDLAFQVRKDTTAPSRPRSLKVSGSTVSWKSSRSRDLQTTIVRIQPGRWSSPTSGLLLNVGRRTSARLPELPPGTSWTVSAFSVDKTGNVNKPRQLSVRG